jgi:hypothetical protein
VVLDPADGDLRFTKIGGGARHSLAITGVSFVYYSILKVEDSGFIYTWGAGGYGQLGHNNKVQHELTPKRITKPDNVKYVSSLAPF